MPANIILYIGYPLVSPQERMEKLQRNIAKEAARQKAAIEACS